MMERRTERQGIDWVIPLGSDLYILSLIDKLMIGSLHHGSLLQRNELRFIVNLNWLNVKRV